MNGRQNASSNSSSSSNHRQYPSSRHGNGGSHRSVRFGDDYQHSHGSDDYGPFQWLKDLATACLALLCIAGLSTILVVLYVTVRPFSLPLYRRLAAQLGGAPFLDAVALLLPNTRLYLTGDSDVPSPVGTSLMVSNHLVDGDWWAILMLARSVGLRGSVKVFLRNEYLQINMDSSKGAVPTSEALICNRTSTGPAHNGYQNSSLHFQTPLHSQLPHASHHHPQDLSLLAKLLHLFLEFPLINGEDYMSNRNQLFQLLRSFAETTGTTPLQLLFFPEGWSQHNGADRSSILDKSNEFARREGRPQLKHLLLPRTRGFNASLECLRESSPIVYDVTMVRCFVPFKTCIVPEFIRQTNRPKFYILSQAYSGYDGSLPPSVKLCVFTLWNILRRKFPKEIHIQIKRYSMEEVFQGKKRIVLRYQVLLHVSLTQCFDLQIPPGWTRNGPRKIDCSVIS
jgi:hypothetical protein